jgi:glycosyltransferase involved in cell wall biosynthesis
VATNLAELGNEVLVCTFLTSPDEPSSELTSAIDRLRIARTDLTRSYAQRLTGRFEFLKFYYRSLVIFGSLTGIIRKHKIDLIYQRSSHYDFAGTLAGLLLQRPVVLEAHDPLKTSFSLRWADRIVVVGSRAMLGRGVEGERVEEVSNCCNIHMFNPGVDGSEVRRKYGWSDKNLVVVYSGGFYPWHGLEDLVEAAELIKEKLPEARFLLVGDGETFAQTRSSVGAHDLQDRFIFTGRIPYREVPKYLAAADIAVAPYDSRKNPYTKRLGFFFSPIKLLEYMAAGKPIITTREEGIMTMIEDRKTGLLVDPGKPDEIATAITLLWKNPQLLKSLGLNARKTAVEKHSWEKLASHLNDLFKDVSRVRSARAHPIPWMRSILYLSLRGLKDVASNLLRLLVGSTRR